MAGAVGIAATAGGASLLATDVLAPGANRDSNSGHDSGDNPGDIQGSLAIDDVTVETDDGRLEALPFRLDGEVEYSAVDGSPTELVLGLNAGATPDQIDANGKPVRELSFDVEEQSTLGQTNGNIAYTFEQVDLLAAPSLEADQFSAPPGDDATTPVEILLSAALFDGDTVIIEATLETSFAVTVKNRPGSMEVTGEGEVLLDD